MFDSDERVQNTKAYREAYGVALKTLTEIMLDENQYTAEDRIEAAEAILENMPREEKEEVK